MYCPKRPSVLLDWTSGNFWLVWFSNRTMEGLTQCQNCSASDGTSWMGFCSFYLSGSDKTLISCDTRRAPFSIKTGGALRDHLSNPSFYRPGSWGPHRVTDAVSIKRVMSWLLPAQQFQRRGSLIQSREVAASISLVRFLEQPSHFWLATCFCICLADSTYFCLQSSR